MTKHKTLVVNREDLKPWFKSIEIKDLKLEHLHTELNRASHTASIIIFIDLNGNAKILKDRFATLSQGVYNETKVTT